VLPAAAGLGARVDASVGLARNGYRGVAVASVLLAVLSAALSAAVSALASDADSFEGLLQLAFSGRLWGLLALAFVPWLYLNLVIVLRLWAQAEGLVRGGFDDWRVALAALPGALLAALVYVVATTLGTLAFIVPGAYLSVAWILWPMTCVVERCGGLASLSRSTALVSGRWLPTAALVTVVTVVVAAAGMCAGVVGTALALFAGSHERLGAMLGGGVSFAAGVLLAPLVPAALVIAYRDCRASQAGSSTT